MIVVFYEPLPDDPDSGPIVCCVEAPQAVIDAWGKPYLVVDQRRNDWDVTHEVVGRQVVARAAAAVADDRLTEALARLRIQRGPLLREVDSINPIRWSALSEADRAGLAAYRQALLDWPATEPDPLNPTPPPVPSFLG
jgi:hypothetical protein